jgi:hypothetical protein
MTRLLLPVSLSLGLLLAASAPAQCFDPNVLGTYIGSANDWVSGHYPLGFSFPMAGSAGTGSWTHVRVCTNGWLALTNGTTDVGLPGAFDFGSVDLGAAYSLYGPQGSNPRMAPYWSDLLVSHGMFIDTATTQGTSARITWSGVYQGVMLYQHTFQVELFVTGEVKFRYYDAGPNARAFYCGLSAANGTGSQPARDFVPGPAIPTQVPGIHQVLPALGSDLNWTELTFTPQGSGWRQAVTCGMQAQHDQYGVGCYASPAQGFYQHFGTAAQAAAALNGNAIQFAISGDSYAASWLPGGGYGYVMPSGNAGALPTSDDGSHLLQLPYPLPTPDGPVSSLRVTHNGVVHFDSPNTSPHDGDFTPSGAEFAASPLAGIYCWHDFNENEAIQNLYYEQIGNVFYLTWHGIESYATPETSNPSWLQYQFDLVTGTVRLVFNSLSAVSTSSRGSSYLVGCKGLGAIADPGSAVLTSSLPRTMRFGITPPMQLWSDTPPISSQFSGSTVVYQHAFVPEVSPGQRLGFTILSFGQNPTGMSLAPLGMPGCSQYLATLDSTLLFATSSPVPTTSLTLPPGVPSGTRIFAQAAAMVPPGSANALGVVVSNAVASTISWW